jgi:hypothetical protein
VQGETLLQILGLPESSLDNMADQVYKMKNRYRSWWASQDRAMQERFSAAHCRASLDATDGTAVAPAAGVEEGPTLALAPSAAEGEAQAATAGRVEEGPTLALAPSAAEGEAQAAGNEEEEGDNSTSSFSSSGSGEAAAGNQPVGQTPSTLTQPRTHARLRRASLRKKPEMPPQLGQKRQATSSPTASDTSSSKASPEAAANPQHRQRVATKAVSRSKAGMLQLQFTRFC